MTHITDHIVNQKNSYSVKLLIASTTFTKKKKQFGFNLIPVFPSLSKPALASMCVSKVDEGLKIRINST